MPWPHLGPLWYRCHEMCQLQLNMPWQVQVQSPIELYGLWKAKIPPRRKRKFRVLIVQFWIFQRFVNFSWNLNYVQCSSHVFTNPEFSICNWVFLSKKIVFSIKTKISVQGVLALGGHFATLCQKVDFYEAKLFFFIINF
jgi:hypothetical protein